VKIEYDVALYKEIAKFKLNEVVITRSRKGKKTTIHITNITQLSWHQLQLLVREGQNKFSKMVLLYKKYSDKKPSIKLQTEINYKGEELSLTEMNEIKEYVKIFNSNGCTKHHEVNLFITNNNAWGKFPTMRSLNDHAEHKKIKGILPKYFEIICEILKITGEKGAPLDKCIHY